MFKYCLIIDDEKKYEIDSDIIVFSLNSNISDGSQKYKKSFTLTLNNDTELLEEEIKKLQAADNFLCKELDGNTPITIKYIFTDTTSKSKEFTLINNEIPANNFMLTLNHVDPVTGIIYLLTQLVIYFN